jgi:hypothetical protein
MNYVCLIPTTRPKAVKLAVKASKADGYHRHPEFSAYTERLSERLRGPHDL